MNPSNSGNLSQLAFKGLTGRTLVWCVVQTWTKMSEEQLTTESLMNSTQSPLNFTIKDAPQFTHIALVKVIVLSAMFIVSLSANSAHQRPPRSKGRSSRSRRHVVVSRECPYPRRTRFDFALSFYNYFLAVFCCEIKRLKVERSLAKVTLTKLVTS